MFFDDSPSKIGVYALLLFLNLVCYFLKYDYYSIVFIKAVNVSWSKWKQDGNKFIVENFSIKNRFLFNVWYLLKKVTAYCTFSPEYIKNG